MGLIMPPCEHRGDHLQLICAFAVATFFGEKKKKKEKEKSLSFSILNWRGKEKKKTAQALIKGKQLHQDQKSALKRFTSLGPYARRHCSSPQHGKGLAADLRFV